MAFNIYEWRRNQLLTENQYYGDITGENNKGVLQAFLKDLEKEKNPTPKEIKQIERLKGEIAKLNENSPSVITKTIKELTWPDVEGLALPTKVETIYNKMVLPQNLDRWKKEFSETEQELEVTIDKNDRWDKQVKIEKITQTDPLGFQADTDKNPTLD